MLKKIVFLSLVTAFVLSAASCISTAARDGYSVTIVNDTGETIQYVYINHISVDDPFDGGDRLDSDQIMPNGTRAVIDGVFGSSPEFDIFLVSADGAVYHKRVRLYRTIRFSADDYLMEI